MSLPSLSSQQARAIAPETVAVQSLPRNRAPASPPRIPCLDGLRACAIAFVLLNHGRDQINIRLSPIANNLVVHYWGPLGVELFFGLSGFLITYLLVQEYSATGGISLKKFYLRRGFRILPALFLFLAVVVGLNLAGVVQVPWSSIATSALFVQNYNFHGTSADDSRYVGHLWSLSAEEQFYLLWPFALAWLGPKRVRKAALILALAAPGVRVCCYFLTPWLRGHTNTMFHTTYDFFLWGCLLALYPESPIIERMLKRFRAVGWFCSVVFFYMIVGPLLDMYGGGAYGLPFGLTLRSLCVVFIIAWLGRNPGSWPAKFLNTAPMRAIGVLSYSLYIWQELFMGKGYHTFSNSFIVSMAAALAAACVSYFLMEKPFLELRRRLGASGPLRPAILTTPSVPVSMPEPTGSSLAG